MPSDLVRRDLNVLWHPCAQMRDYQVFPPLEVVGAVGSYLHLADGRRILDAISSWWCKSLGHGHPRIRAAIAGQLEHFEHVILANTTNEGVVRFCERILAAANRDGRHFGKVFLTDNGSNAVEIALKMALQAQQQMGRSGRTRFASLANGYHGETAGCLSVGDCALYAQHYGSMLFETVRLAPMPYRRGPADPAWMDASVEWGHLRPVLDREAEHLAAIVYEPVLQGAGGMRLYAPDLLTRLRAWADAHEVLLIADEIASGLGRCGAMLASHLAPAALPDLVCLSKGLTGGSLPMAAVLATDRLYEVFLAEYHEMKAFLHSNTYAGNALAVAAANAVLDAFDQDGVLEQVALNGPRLVEGLQDLAATRPVLTQVRGLGMMAAVDLCDRAGRPLASSRRTGYAVYREAVRRGALLRNLGDTMYLFPPLNTGPDEIAAMLGILDESVEVVLGGRS